MFGNKETSFLKSEIKRLNDSIDELKKERAHLKEQAEDARLQRKIDEEDIKHMMKMKEERLSIESEKKEMTRAREKEAEIAKVKDDYRNKMEARLNKEVENIKEMYGQILARLPNISAELKGKI